MRLFRNKQTGKYFVATMDDTEHIEVAMFYANIYSINYDHILNEYDEVEKSHIIRKLRKLKINKIYDKKNQFKPTF
jgi:hypothetical protein